MWVPSFVIKTDNTPGINTSKFVLSSFPLQSQRRGNQRYLVQSRRISRDFPTLGNTLQIKQVSNNH